MLSAGRLLARVPALDAGAVRRAPGRRAPPWTVTGRRAGVRVSSGSLFQVRFTSLFQVGRGGALLETLRRGAPGISMQAVTGGDSDTELEGQSLARVRVTVTVRTGSANAVASAVA